MASAENGEVAIERLTNDAELPCVIILDLMMPVMAGEEFRDLQLKEPRLAHIPVIVMSASYEVAKAAARMCAQSVITKPTRAESLLREIERLCADR